MLADYILALLKHDLPAAQLRQNCLEQLNDFLFNDTASFVDLLFQELTRHYGLAAPVAVAAAAAPVMSESDVAAHSKRMQNRSRSKSPPRRMMEEDNGRRRRRSDDDEDDRRPRRYDEDNESMEDDRRWRREHDREASPSRQDDGRSSKRSRFSERGSSDRPRRMCYDYMNKGY